MNRESCSISTERNLLERCYPIILTLVEGQGDFIDTELLQLQHDMAAYFKARGDLASEFLIVDQEG